jgi:hypothetical protein
VLESSGAPQQKRASLGNSNQDPMPGSFLGNLVFETVLGPLGELVIEWFGPRIAGRVTTTGLAVICVLGLTAFGVGCYLLAAAASVLWVGLGATGLVLGLPTALIAGMLWRDLRLKRLQRYVRRSRQ